MTSSWSCDLGQCLLCSSKTQVVKAWSTLWWNFEAMRPIGRSLGNGLWFEGDHGNTTVSSASFLSWPPGRILLDIHFLPDQIIVSGFVIVTESWLIQADCTIFLKNRYGDHHLLDREDEMNKYMWHAAPDTSSINKCSANTRNDNFPII